MSMDIENWSLTLSLSLFLSILSIALSSEFPSQGCYWTEECLHKLQGDCGGLVYNQSRDCYGNCDGPKYLPCQPDHTHFYCCVPGSPIKMKDGCTKCVSKVEGGDEIVCCSDCTYPELVYSDSSTGYCKSGADLISQPKPKEVFRWVAGPWLPCSMHCGGGVRSRRVDCYAVVEDTSSADYPVYDDLCSDQEKLTTQEPCNRQRCVDRVVSRSTETKNRGNTSSWLLITPLVLLIGAVGFTGYILYKRKTSNQPNDGYVYIMMEGFA